MLLENIIQKTNMKKLALSIFILFFIAFSVNAQKFVIPLEGFSKKKAAYFHMEDGETIEGTLNGFKRTKGLIETVKMKDEKGNKLKVDPSKISHMYLAPSAFAKLSASMEQIYSVENWEKDNSINADLMKEGYVFFEKVKTKVKKKEDNLMLQVMNPSFSGVVKVYHDPFAGETASVGVGSLTLAGGLDKSYYVKKESDNAAYRLKKKEYKDQFEDLFGDSKEFMEKYSSDINWSDFEEHIYEYTELMK